MGTSWVFVVSKADSSRRGDAYSNDVFGDCVRSDGDTLMSCTGCRLANQLVETLVVFEDDLITCILDIDPLHEGHTLILPKKHYKDLDELDEPTTNSIMKASILISKVLKAIYEPDGITIMQNGGLFNDLDHYHMHVFPRYKDDGFAWLEPSNKFITEWSQVKKIMIEKLREVAL